SRGRSGAADAGGRMRVLDGEQVLVRIFIGESDRWHHQPLWAALLQRLRRHGLAGATVLRRIGGFRCRQPVHTNLRQGRAQAPPLLIEVVETEEHVERLLPILDEMVAEGMVTMETERVIKYLPGKRPLDGA